MASKKAKVSVSVADGKLVVTINGTKIDNATSFNAGVEQYGDEPEVYFSVYVEEDVNGVRKSTSYYGEGSKIPNESSLTPVKTDIVGVIAFEDNVSLKEDIKNFFQR